MIIRKKLIPILIILTALLGVFGYGAVKNSTEIRSFLETGGVKIGIQTLEIQNGCAAKLPAEVKVDCEKPISYVPRITNYGAACYLRVRLLAKVGEHELELLDYLQNTEVGWVRKGAYLYYREPVSGGESVDVCRAFQMPETWDFYQDKSLQIQTEADALQAKNFSPDFTSETPWGNLVVTASRIEAGNRLETVECADDDLQKTEGNPYAVAADRQKGLVLEEGEFFSHVMLLPGDSRTESLKLSNRETEKIQILMRAEWEKSSFLDKMQLKIDNGDGFYDGVLTGAQMRDYRVLASLNPGETKTVDVTISFPESADNRYQQNSDDIRWCFAVKHENDSGAPVTGDAEARWAFAAAGCGAAILGIRCMRKRRRDEQEA